MRGAWGCDRCDLDRESVVQAALTRPAEACVITGALLSAVGAQCGNCLQEGGGETAYAFDDSELARSQGRRHIEPQALTRMPL